MPRQLVMGFDFGLKRIGVAVGQQVTQTATALTVLSAKNGVPSVATVQRLIQTWQPTALVVGIPLDMEGGALDVTEKAREFAIWLQQFHLPVHEADERLSTKSARAAVFEQEGYRGLARHLDDVAAKIILEAWLRTHHDETSTDD